MMRFWLPVLPLALVAALAMAGQPVPFDPEFQVNTFTPGRQNYPDIAFGPDGRFVVVWASEDQDGDSFGIFGRRFDAHGVPLGGEFQVNTFTASSQSVPRVAMDGSGNVIVVWRSIGQDGDGRGVFGRRFDSAGVPLAGEFQVNVATVGNQNRPDVAADAAGNFIVVWEDYAFFPSPADIVARRFDDTGTPIGSEIVVSTEGGALEHSPSIGMNEAGRFVVVWGRPDASYGLYNALYGQLFDPSGQPEGNEFRVGAFTSGTYPYGDYATRVGMNQDGEFIVVWERRVDLDVEWGVFGHPFDSTGSARGAEVAISSYPQAVFPRDPDVAMEDDGSFIVVWAESSDVFAEHFDAMGNSDGGEIQINTAAAWDQQSPSIGWGQSGSFVAAWTRRHTFNETDIIARRLLTACTGAVRELDMEIAGGGTELFLTWTDALNADDYVLFEDGFPGGDFSTMAGTSSSGAIGLTIPAPAGNKYYLVGGRSTSCGLGPLR